MATRFFITLILVVVLIGCDGPKKPENLISKKEMVHILIDSKLIAVANSGNRKILDKEGGFPSKYVFKKYNIDSVQFAESNAYYTYYVEDYEEIHQKAKDSLERLKKDLKAQQEKEKKEKLKKRKKSQNKSNSNEPLKLKKVNEETLIENGIEELDFDEDDLEIIESISNK